MENNIPQEWNKFYLKDVSFVNLMMRRIYNVLIVANPYDAFMLEDDGRIEEKIYNEYMELGLRYPPTFTQVSTTEEAAAVLRSTVIDLVICMPGNADNDAFDVARDIKGKFPNIHCVVLTPFSHGITKRMQNEDLSIFDYVFCWLGNTNLILSIIKLIEDKMNLEHDIQEAGVQMILLVEDSIRFYSSILPNLYNYILEQSKNFSQEALNRHAATMRMRGRPKVVLARTYEEAQKLYDKYSDNTLGVISDARFPLKSAAKAFGNEVMPEEKPKHRTDTFGREKCPDAGLQLFRYIRKNDPFVPLIIESSESENRAKAEAEGFRFVDKNSKKMSVDLRRLMEEHMGFGDFIFRDPKTHEEIMRIHSLKELQDNIFNIPNDSMLYHISRNHMSRWLCARAIFPVSAFLKHVTWEKLQDVDAHRQIIFDAIVQYRHMKNIGVVAVFDRMKFDKYAHFARIGEGSLGGKGRGLAFLDNVIKRHPEFNQFENATVQIPKTVVLCTDIFDEFMMSNNLYPIALSDASDDEILKHFLHAQLPDSLIADFFTFFEATRSPIAIRSSSLLEDAHYQPFAGIYSTYMIPYLEDKYQMLQMLACAIKGVYASVFYRDSKAYMTATSNVIDQEKMAVILQQVVGKDYGTRFYPTMSGVLRSLNYYPIGDEEAEEGIASLALGLGKYIVDGGQTLRVCPYHPNQVLQTSETELALRDTQTQFYALDMKHVGNDFKVDDGFNILKLRVKDAVEDQSLTYIASTFDLYDQVINDGVYENGRKLITFSSVLQHGVVPLPEILQMSMKYGAGAMRRPVEIEFACNINNDRTCEFYLLQIRPIVDAKEMLDEDVKAIPDSDCLLRSHNSLGHGISEDVVDVVYVKYDDHFSAMNNFYVADDIERINRKFLADGKNYVLIGPGRWGSSDHYLGVPVKWPHISAARVIVEVALKNYNIDPSQGTHFFQNLTSFGVGYFTVDTNTGEGGFVNKEILDAMPAVEETQYVRHVRFEHPMRILMDGKKQEGAVLIPKE
ncbi:MULTISPECIES: PEP/pyruvate-binding domain-containing protein [Segatella]|uniref:PEP/pyruvate-binding domain-containing protein n=1 Tax=Segatella TaxID=2974251 RepID=UPI001290F925|nr:PEP/pyruvate-binding domain-containing protein [Segatella copri]MBW0035287.1 phosphoenolpyruvate synthase [Segatella copri]MQM47163.1 phosphoenolpyruvate synthase [Segatella copri]MQM50817.1 phosphoenolpyruvate synthase [Segatella copri]MQM68198.1 phosphoenolpyruvate synthase [Segatella copri]MQM74952.1 phosphoenolpyruvate synthase [Segatella copri]